MKPIYLVLIAVLLTGCLKAGVSPVLPKSTTKTDSLKTTINTIQATSIKTDNTDTDPSNPEYWYNGTKGTALIQVTCNNCTAIATIGKDVVPFMIDSKGVGKLKYTPASGLLINIAVCPTGTQAIKAEVLDAANNTSYAYSGVLSSNWSGAYTVK